VPTIANIPNVNPAVKFRLNVGFTSSAKYRGNLLATPVVLQSGPYIMHEGGIAFGRRLTAQPSQGNGDSIPLGPQRWPV
jgi:hypothetical protein